VDEPPGSTVSLAGDDPDRPLANTEPVLALVFECGRPHAGSVRYRLADLLGVSLGRGVARGHEREGTELSIQVPDRWMSSRHARIEAGFGRWTFIDESKNGSIVDGISTKRTLLEDGALIEVGHSLFVFFECFEIEHGAPDVLELAPTRDGAWMASLSPAWQAELERARQLATTDVPVMIEGENGVGKRLLARTIHDQSGRSGAFVYVDCGELADHEVERALFGDAEQPGLLHAASGGTLMLDDIGSLAASAQARLMRVVQARPPIDVRILCATDRDLNDKVAADQFRGDLFACLAGLRVVVPPLGDRRIDLGLLIGTLHHRLSADGHPGYAIDAARMLLRYPWPLNVWELEQALTTAHVLAGSDLVRGDHLPESVRACRPPGAPATVVLSDADQELHDRVRAALREHRGNISAVARALAKDRRQIQRWIERFGFEADKYR